MKRAVPGHGRKLMWGDPVLVASALSSFAGIGRELLMLDRRAVAVAGERLQEEQGTDLSKVIYINQDILLPSRRLEGRAPSIAQNYEFDLCRQTVW